MFKMNRNEDAVSPVIGVILMVAITVILAAVIAAFVFGMGPSEMAPQSSVRASADTIDGVNAVMVEHQGGDEIVLTPSTTRVVFNGTDVVLGDTITADAASERFEAGETLYLSNTSTEYVLDLSENATGSNEPVATQGETVSLKFIDVGSQQMIADLDVRF